MINMLRRIGTALVSATLIAATGGIYSQASSAPLASHPAPHKPAHICTTGHRGQPAYDRACLTTATPKTAARLWATVPETSKSRAHDDMTTQRNICTYGHRHGGAAAWAADMVNDMAYDTYRNYAQVTRWVGQDAALTCAQLGYGYHA